MRTLKIYEVNYDGRVRRGVFTDTKKRALELLDVKAHHFNEYGMVRDWELEADAALRAAPHTAMEAHMNSRGKKEWFPLHTYRDYALYEHQCKRAGNVALPFDDWLAERDEQGEAS